MPAPNDLEEVRMRKRHVGTRSLGISALAVAASLVGAVSAMAAPPATPWTQCPAVGANTSCRILIVVSNGGTQAFVDNAQASTYDGDDDTLIGIVNQRTGQNATLNSLDLSSPTLPIFGFDSDGLCTQTPGPNCTGFPDPNGYGGPGVTFSNISSDHMSGTVNFSPGIVSGGSSYFSLEDEIGVSDLFGLETHVSQHFTAVGGAGVSDTAVISSDDDPNDNNRPTGLITWHVYGPDDPSCSGDPVDTFVHGVDGNGAYTSGEFHPTTAGFYTFVADFVSDNQSFPSQTSSCTDSEEQFGVGPKLTTNAEVTATVGETIHDVATLSGAQDPVGNITFSLYGPDDPNCEHVPVFIVDAPVQTGNGDYLSREFTTTQAGTYRWVARWNGDANDPAVETGCNDPNETTVVNPTPIVVVPAHSTSHARFKVKYARVVKTNGQAGYLLLRVNSKRAKHVKLRIRLTAKHWSGQRVTRTIRTNRAVKLRGLHLIGAQRVRITVLG
jgi:hypothetical protein